jgi:hypothetical protein
LLIAETTGSRTRLNIIGAIRLGFLSEAIPHQYKTVNGESIIDFFEKIKAQYVSMTLSTPVLIQPEVTFVACVGGTASMNKSGSSHAREAFRLLIAKPLLVKPFIHP